MSTPTKLLTLMPTLTPMLTSTPMGIPIENKFILKKNFLNFSWPTPTSTPIRKNSFWNFKKYFQSLRSDSILVLVRPSVVRSVRNTFVMLSLFSQLGSTYAVYTALFFFADADWKLIFSIFFFANANADTLKFFLNLFRNCLINRCCRRRHQHQHR